MVRMLSQDYNVLTELQCSHRTAVFSWNCSVLTQLRSFSQNYGVVTQPQLSHRTTVFLQSSSFLTEVQLSHLTTAFPQTNSILTEHQCSLRATAFTQNCSFLTLLPCENTAQTKQGVEKEQYKHNRRSQDHTTGFSVHKVLWSIVTVCLMPAPPNTTARLLSRVSALH